MNVGCSTSAATWVQLTLDAPSLRVQLGVHGRAVPPNHVERREDLFDYMSQALKWGLTLLLAAGKEPGVQHAVDRLEFERIGDDDLPVGLVAEQGADDDLLIHQPRPRDVVRDVEDGQGVSAVSEGARRGSEGRHAHGERHGGCIKSGYIEMSPT